MRRLCLVVLLGMMMMPTLWADTQDTVVFRTRMLPDNEVPPVAASGNSAAATITVRVTRDDRGNINAATVTFDIDYTVSSAVTFTGLHIHNAPVAQNGPIFIDTGITATNPVSATAGTGRITRVVNYNSTETTGLRYVTGLLAMPENYYVNIHTTTNPDGFMRGQLLPTRLIFRPVMSPAFEIPLVSNLDAEGAAMIDIQVERNPQTGAITSGTVIFDVEYRFPSPVTITGLHLHNGPFGVAAPVVIDSGLNGNTRSITNATRGNIFRVAEIPSTNTDGIAALTGIFRDPTQYYINLHTTVNPAGAIRGQLDRNYYAFFNLMTGAEEVPPAATSGTANSMTYVFVNRDVTGNITHGFVSFNVNFNMGGPVTFSGLHIHNGKFGVAAGVVISSGLGNTVDDDGIGSFNFEIPITTANATQFNSLRGLIENPENYYINIHTTTFPGGINRAQLARETYRFKANMTAANEVPPANSNTTATGWISVKPSRDGSGAINGGTVVFDVNFVTDGPMTFTGLHIHHSGVAGQNAPAILNTNLSGTNPVETTAPGNVTRVVTVQPTSATGLAALNALVTAPDTTYINIHSTTFPGGVARSQMFGVVNTVAQVAGGAEWSTNITIRNPSSTAAVQGQVVFFQSNGSLMPDSITDPSVAFLIPPSGSVTLSTHNKGNLTSGFARVFSNGNVTVDARYIHPQFAPAMTPSTTVTARSVSLPVSVSGTANTGVTLIASSAGTLNISLRDSAGAAITGGSRTLDVTAGQQLSLFVNQLLPSVTATSFSGTLTITASAGTMSVMALQFNGTMSPVTVTALP